MRPQYLKEGDRILEVGAGTGAYSLYYASKGYNWKAQFESWGLKVKVSEHITDRIHYDFAGDHKLRAEELTKMVLDKDVKAIVSIRGGYGTMHTIKHLDMNIFKENPKWIIGYSDITILHYALQKMGIESIHGAMPGTFTEEFDGFSQNSLKDALFGNVAAYTTNPSKYNNFGAGEGKLIGGNITLLRNLVGTSLDNDYNEPTILFIEDTEATPLQDFDRDLQALIHQEDFKHVKAIVIGRFQKGSKVTKEGLEFVIHTKEELKDMPVIANVDFGHTSPILTIPLGGFAKIENGCFTIKG